MPSRGSNRTSSGPGWRGTVPAAVHRRAHDAVEAILDDPRRRQLEREHRHDHSDRRHAPASGRAPRSARAARSDAGRRPCRAPPLPGTASLTRPPRARVPLRAPAPGRAARRGRRARSARRESPRSTTRPSSSTTIWSASRTLATRCEITITVRPREDLAQVAADRGLGLGVDARERVVEDQDARPQRERARQRGALALAAREHHAALADQRVVARRAARRRPWRAARAPPPRAPARGSGRGEAVRDVLAERHREQEGVLRHHRDVRAQRARAGSGSRRHRRGRAGRRAPRRAAGSARPACSCPNRWAPRRRARDAGRHVQRHAAQRLLAARVVAEREVAELDLAPQRARPAARPGAVGDRRLHRRAPRRCAASPRARAAPARTPSP